MENNCGICGGIKQPFESLCEFCLEKQTIEHISNTVKMFNGGNRMYRTVVCYKCKKDFEIKTRDNKNSIFHICPGCKPKEKKQIVKH